MTVVDLGPGGVGGHRDHDVLQRDDEERAELWVRRAVERRDLDVGEREKGSLGGVEIVGQPASVAILGEAEKSGDPVAGRLDNDALVALLHGE